MCVTIKSGEVCIVDIYHRGECHKRRCVGEPKKYAMIQQRKANSAEVGSDVLKSKQRHHIQLGLVVDGLAITTPGLAPGALEPSGPMLLSTPCRAMGLSAAMKFAREPLARLSSR